MDTYRTEEEQIEALKRWWMENGRSMITAVIFALAVGFGWQGWQSYREEQSAAASNLYQGMLQNLSREDNAGAAGAAEELKRDYGRSTYAQFAALHLARLAVIGDDLAKAERELRWVLEHADSGSETWQLAQLRLARVLAAAGNPQQGLDILDSADPGSFQASYQSVRGDILLQLGRREEAKEAFSSALMLAARGGEQISTSMLQEKLQSLSPESPRAVVQAEAGLPAEQAQEAQVEQGDVDSGAEE